MQKCNTKHIWQYFRQHRVASIIVGHVIVLSVLGLALFGGVFNTNILGASAAACTSGDKTYVVVSGDTLGGIAARHNTTWQKLATYNRIANANVIHVNQNICIPGAGKGTGTTANQQSSGKIEPLVTAAKGASNRFPYGQCTWWASQRVFQKTGIFVPWTTNSNAWQWTARANDFGWRVSGAPKVGAIITLQPGVQGAGYLGHVGVVEQVLGNGKVVVSNMNWGANPGAVTYVTFSQGGGVSFISPA